MFRAALSRGRTWLTPVLALACASIVASWFVAHSALERAVLVGSVVLSSGVAVFLGWRLSHEVSRRHERLVTLAGIVETTGDAVIAARLDRTITAWNSGAEHLFGYTAEEMIGDSISRIVPPGDEDSLQDHLEQMLEKNRMHTYEVKRQRKDGSLVDVQITLSPLRDDDGRTVAISSIIRDISERRRLEAEREELLAREREARAEAEYARARRGAEPAPRRARPDEGRLRRVGVARAAHAADIDQRLPGPHARRTGRLVAGARAVPLGRAS
jgi:PAS domain S-box-containing protein